MLKLPALLTLSLLLPLTACVTQPGPFVEEEIPDTISVGEEEEEEEEDVDIEDDFPPLAAPLSGHAFLLAHGFGGNSDSFDAAIIKALLDDGHAVLAADVTPIEGSDVRAAELAQQVDMLIAGTGVAKVHVIAHSQGGLDARVMISSLNYADKVASLTTISTPHQGTPLADLARGLIGDPEEQEAALTLFEALGVEVDPDALERALIDLSEESAAAFNAANPDAPEVLYQSYAGLSTWLGLSPRDDAELACAGASAGPIPEPDRLGSILNFSGPYVASVGEEIQAHDGVVPVLSGIHGIFLGCIEADHLDEIVYDAESDFSSVDLYRDIASKLASP